MLLLSDGALEGELFGKLVQGGAFAVLVFIIVWAIIRLEPRVREMMEKKDLLYAEMMQKSVTTFGEAVQKIVAECASVMRQQMEESRRSLETVLQKHQEQSNLDRKECRDERKEWMENMQKEGIENRELIQREGDLNRKSRNDFVSQIQRAMSEVLQEGKARGHKERDDEGDDPDKRRRAQS